MSNEAQQTEKREERREEERERRGTEGKTGEKGQCSEPLCSHKNRVMREDKVTDHRQGRYGQSCMATYLLTPTPPASHRKQNMKFELCDTPVLKLVTQC